MEDHYRILPYYWEGNVDVLILFFSLFLVSISGGYDRDKVAGKY